MGILTFFGRLFGKKSDPSGLGFGNSQKNGNGNGKAGVHLTCVDCKRNFLFEEGEQRFFKMRGLTPPKRCPSCRSKRKHRR